MSMSLSHLTIGKTDDLPIKHLGSVHNGKVRSVYWLTPEDSQRIVQSRGYPVPVDTLLGVMVISDRISAYEIIWQGEDGLMGIPGKGASLNATAEHWFGEFDKAGLASHHILETPHPLVWIVRQAQPVMVEAIARQYITGSMWRAYAAGERDVCGIRLPEGLSNGDRLPELLITPSSKGIMRGIPGVPEKDDVNITRQQILDNWAAFRFASPADVDIYEQLLEQGFELIARKAASAGQILADTKFEFGYVADQAASGQRSLIYMDEVGTLDSSRYWDVAAYEDGRTVENSKEMFRKHLCDSVPDKDVLLNKSRMAERIELGKSFKIPVEAMLATSRLYCDIAEQLTEKPVPKIENAYQEILDYLSPFGLIE
jgi:phosphoribosylaminoimidazole-succinocarboxamide synthase